MVKRLLLGVLSLVLGIGLILSCGESPDTKTIEAGVENKAEKVAITDSNGSNVEISVNINNIADA